MLSPPLVTGSSISGSSAKLVSTRSSPEPGKVGVSPPPTGSSMMSGPPGSGSFGVGSRQMPVLMKQRLNWASSA